MESEEPSAGAGRRAARSRRELPRQPPPPTAWQRRCSPAPAPRGRSLDNRPHGGPVPPRPPLAPPCWATRARHRRRCPPSPSAPPWPPSTHWTGGPTSRPWPAAAGPARAVMATAEDPRREAGRMDPHGAEGREAAELLLSREREERESAGEAERARGEGEGP
ncbi:hypothetical protein ANANG_G00169130 [Anguilla anguilla]|uniref:Uncharacterized protein n=1 Tax=Anguilla anguilla TaxID=7936 RepID=A0A9D3M348_ANGAN|nr:hypothetical protein ANANG_G00169130 [Anguilla anguilla]